MRLSEHFSLEEFHCRNGSPVPPSLVPRLRLLCEQLEIIRTMCGDRPMTVVSGYRTHAYNATIGGARDSRHTYGDAADIRVAGLRANAVHKRILAGMRAGDLKIGGLGLYPRWVHVDVRPSREWRCAQWSGKRVIA